MLISRTLPDGPRIERIFDDADNILSEVMTADTGGEGGEGERLMERAIHRTSFDKVDKIVEGLGLNADSVHLVRVTEREFDTSGRTVIVRGGPALETVDLFLESEDD